MCFNWNRTLNFYSLSNRRIKENISKNFSFFLWKLRYFHDSFSLFEMFDLFLSYFLIYSYNRVSSRKSYESSCIDIAQWTRALKQTKEKQTKNILKYFLFCCSIRFKNRFIERNMKENSRARLQIKMYSFLLLICDFVLISLFIHRSFIHLDLNAWSRKTSIRKMKESLF